MLVAYEFSKAGLSWEHYMSGHESRPTSGSAGSGCPPKMLSGLTSREAEELLERFGPNEISEKHRSVFMEFGTKFWGPIPWMIEFALVLTALASRWLDLATIAALLVMNGAIGFWEEHQAGNAIEALKRQLAVRARVCRNGQWQTIEVREIVPGDLAHLEIGQVVPADGHMVSGECEVDQATLTGESLPVTRTAGQNLYSGSVITRGDGELRVTATGVSTMFGTVARLAQKAPPPSHFQRAVLAIGRYLILLAILLVGLIVVVSTAQGKPISETLEFALVVTIASVPIALPAVLSVTMAVGARSLSQRQAVVSHLPAVEELAGVDVLCVDKTGTITLNKLSLGIPVVLDSTVDVDNVRLMASLASRAESRDAIDAVILASVPQARRQNYQLLDFKPFDPVRKRAEATIRGPGGDVFEVAKGAPQAIAALVSGRMSDDLEKTVSNFADRGFRSLAVSRRIKGHSWKLLGVLPLHDPPRDDSKTTLANAMDLGLSIKMVTGDQLAIAQEIAGEVGLGKNISDIAQIGGDEEHFASLVEAADGFAQVVPEDKYRIVEALQREGHIVAMTGDGVNDAPALRRADAGVAVVGATDAARAAADIVLLAPGLSVIVEALHMSREIFRRMTNYAIYRIAETMRVVVFIAVAIVASGFFPLTASMVVLLALMNDAAILSIAFDHVKASPFPERWNMREVITISSVLGGVGVIESMSLLYVGQHVFGMDHDLLRTLLYLKLSVAGHLTVFVARTRGPFWTIRPANILLVAVVGTQLLATGIAVGGFLMASLAWIYVLLAWAWALAWFFMLDAAKLVAYRVLDWKA